MVVPIACEGEGTTGIAKAVRTAVNRKPAPLISAAPVIVERRPDSAALDGRDGKPDDGERAETAGVKCKPRPRARSG